MDIKTEFPLQVEITFPVQEILSENMLYQPIARGGKSRFMLTNRSRSYKNEIDQVIREMITPDIQNIFEQLQKLDLMIEAKWFFYLPRNLIITKDGRLKKRRDVTNMIKGVEDSVFNVLGIDDSVVTHSEITKVPCDGPEMMTFKHVIQLLLKISEISLADCIKTEFPQKSKFRVVGGNRPCSDVFL